MPMVFINDKKTDVDIEKYNIFSEILDDIYIYINKLEDEQVITEIELNNENLTENRERELYSLPSSRINSLKIYTTSNEQVIKKTIIDLRLFLDSLIENTMNVSQLLRNAGVEEANKEFEKFLSDIDLYITATGSLLKALKERSKKECIYNEAVVAKLQSDLLTLTKNMLKTQSDKDWIMLADLLEYEFIPNMTEWAEFLTVLKSYS